MSKNIQTTILGIEAKTKDGFLIAPDGVEYKIINPRKKIAGLGGKVTMVKLVDHIANLFQQGNNGETIAQMCGFKDSDAVSKYKKIAVSFGLLEIDLTRKNGTTENPEYKDADFERFMQVVEIKNNVPTKTMQEFYSYMYDPYLLKNEGDIFGAKSKASKACHAVFQICKRLNRTPRALIAPELYHSQGAQAWKKYLKDMLLTIDESDGKNCKDFIKTQHVKGANYKGGKGAYYNVVKWLRHFIYFCEIHLRKGDPELAGWLSGETISTHGDRAGWRLTIDQINDFVKYCHGEKNSIKFPYPELVKSGVMGGVAACYMGLGLRKAEGLANKMKYWEMSEDPEDNSVTISGKVLSHKNKHKANKKMFIEKQAYESDLYVLQKCREYIRKRIEDKEFCLIGDKNQFVKPASKDDIKNGIIDHYDALTFRGKSSVDKIYANIRAIYEHMDLNPEFSENPLHALRHFTIQLWLDITDFEYDIVAEIMGYEHGGVTNSTELRKSYGRPPSYRASRKIKKLLKGYKDGNNSEVSTKAKRKQNGD